MEDSAWKRNTNYGVLFFAEQLPGRTTGAFFIFWPAPQNCGEHCGQRECRILIFYVYIVTTMNISRKHDIVLNIIFPIALGYFFYLLGMNISFPAVIKNYLADGLWAYAFISCILIIWDRKLNILWILITFFVSILFELFQGFHLLHGTGDIIDIGIYILFFTVALIVNKFIVKSIYYDKS